MRASVLASIPDTASQANASAKPWENVTAQERQELAETLALLNLGEHDYWTLLDKADACVVAHHGTAVRFERSIFFSWYCSIRDCAFCYMSTQPKDKTRMARRTFESLYVETFLSRVLGWQFGFLSGGTGVYTPAEIKGLIKNVSGILGKRIWLNIGVISETLLKDISPFIEGVTGSVETVDRELHPKVCPSKPLEPIEKMYGHAAALGLQNAMTFIIGLGEKPSVIRELEEFISKHHIVKIHLYGLNPQAGTAYESTTPPSKYLQAWYIANIRLAFPDLDIEAGVWEDRISYIPLLLHAGATSLSKFPATRLFGKKQSFDFEDAVRSAGREFLGTLTKMPAPGFDWVAQIAKLDADEDVKELIRKKLFDYVDVMAGTKKLVRRSGKGQSRTRKVVAVQKTVQEQGKNI